MNLLE